MKHASSETDWRRLTCTWCSRRRGPTGPRWRLWNERWISRRAQGAAQGTSLPSRLDSGEGQGARSADLSSVSGCRARRAPNLSAALDQVLHVPLHHVQMLLDVVEMLNGFVRPQTARVPLVLGRSDLFHRVVEIASAETTTTKKLVRCTYLSSVSGLELCQKLKAFTVSTWGVSKSSPPHCPTEGSKVDVLSPQ